jgi:hypothetical protein
MKKRILTLLIGLLLCTPGLLLAQTGSQWEENLNSLVKELPKRHVAPFTYISQADFLAAAERLRADIPTLSDPQILMRMAALVTLLEDSHTVLRWPMNEPIYPIGLLVFDDDLFGVAAYADAAEALGARLLRVNGYPIEDVIAKVATIIPHENEAWLGAQLPNFLIRSEVLAGLGIIDKADAILWEFETRTGKMVTLKIAPIPPAQLNTSQLRSARPAKGVPPTESTKGNYWLRLFDDGTLYFKYNAAIDAPDLPFARFTEILLKTLAEQPVKRLVIDLRDNTGGNSALIAPLISALKTQPINTPGRLFVIIGARTYSSAVLNAVQLKQETKAVLVGKPTGGAPNHFGEIQHFDLPHFDLRVSYSTKRFETMPSGEARTLMPDVPVRWSINDYIAGIDPAYAAVLAYEP